MHSRAFQNTKRTDNCNRRQFVLTALDFVGDGEFVPAILYQRVTGPGRRAHQA